MLTHLKKYEKKDEMKDEKVYRVCHIDRLITQDQPNQYSVDFEGLKYASGNLLMIHDGGCAWSDDAVDKT